MASMATSEPSGHRSPWTVERARALAGKNEAYTSFISAKSFHAWRNTVTFTTLLRSAPADCRMRLIFRNT